MYKYYGWFVSVGFIGFIPLMPGTFGSLIALPLIWFAQEVIPPLFMPVLILVVFCLGWGAAQIYSSCVQKEDASEIVIDEVVGQAIALLFVPRTLILYGLGFLLFRLFDIAKPSVIGWCDRHIKGGFGIMFDDVMAGLASLIILQTAIWVYSWI